MTYFRRIRGNIVLAVEKYWTRLRLVQYFLQLVQYFHVSAQGHPILCNYYYYFFFWGGGGGQTIPYDHSQYS